MLFFYSFFFSAVKKGNGHSQKFLPIFVSLYFVGTKIIEKNVKG